MKPNFTLDLSQTDVRLMDLSGKSGTLVGEVSLTDPDFDAKISELRNNLAEKLDVPIACELQIPDSEILYTTIDDPEFEGNSGTRRDLRDQAVRDGLEGMTPYALDDLSYTWKPNNSKELMVAAVARETLAEAEGFAASRGFNPVRFVSRPGKDKFRGMVNFGPTAIVTARSEAAKAAASEAELLAAKAAARSDSTKPGHTPDSEPKPAVEPAAGKAAATGAAKGQQSEAVTAEPEGSTAPSTPEKTPPRTHKSDSASLQGDFKLESKPEDPKSDIETDPVKGADAKKSAPVGPDAQQPALRTPATDPFASGGAKGDAGEVPGDFRVTPPQRRMNIAPVDGPQDSDTGNAEDTPPATFQRPSTASSDIPVPRTGFSQPRVNDPLPPLDDIPPVPPSFATRRRTTAGAPALAPQIPSARPFTPGDSASRDSRLGRLAARFGGAPDSDSMTAAGALVPPPPPRRNGTPPAGPVPPLPTSAGPKILRGSGSGGADKTQSDLNNGTVIPSGVKVTAPRLSPVRTLPDTAATAASLTPAADPGQTSGQAPGRSATSPRKAEAEAMTVFGARAGAAKQRSMAPVAIGLIVALLLAIGVWAAVLFLGNDDLAETDASLSDPALETAGAPAAVQPETAIEQPDAIPPQEPPGNILTDADPDPGPETDPISDPVSEPISVPDAGTEIAALPETLAPDDAGGRANVTDSTVATVNPTAPEAPAPEPQPLTSAPPEPISEDPLQRPPTEEGPGAIATRYATTGIWEAPPEAPDAPTIDRIDDLYVASIDPKIEAEDAVALPELSEATAPAAPQSELPPAPSGTVFDMDDNGLVRATPGGAISPDGILITAGRPSKTPPAIPSRPDSLAPILENQPDLPRTRPRTRPGNLVEESERTQLGGRLRTELANLKPKERPEEIASRAASIRESMNARAAAAAAAVAATSLATPQPRPNDPTAAAPAPAEEAPETLVAAVVTGPVSPFAVARSRVPQHRPGNFDDRVASARNKAAEAASQQAAAEPTVTRVAAASAVTTPRIPSRASVAQQATVKNAINLGKMNLIGVYGGTSNRRALIRLPSGKFVKVKVGDRIDGGQVASIGQSDLSYHKGGRRVTLAMPQG
ncbi:hypothetical protein [Oceaniovalibus sp. ACAM 378]|uniref:hypothetical protein n=1 Tax=Oceaniovalibus sp. ACAM 378 TaxID=2599923 RepID=UPI0011D49502|nr:hypothetical protein [Oceaniovalibus sp. ACAM 378]TYB88048.1 hypothetical protein FQ320_12900 [Oceaniovalibus sp. ACAM 378]